MLKRRFLGTMLIGATLALSFVAPAMAESAKTPTAITKTQNGGFVTLTNEEVTPFKVVNPPEGGTWNYGTEVNGNQKRVWSYYIHPDVRHHGEVILGPYPPVKVFAAAGDWAKADISGDKKYTGYAYYGTDPNPSK